MKQLSLSKLLITLALLQYCSISYAQKILITGFCNATYQLEDVIEEAGYSTQKATYNSINTTSLVDKEVLALFNLAQTWSQDQLLTEAQTNDIIDFIKNGGALYITARKGYENLLSKLGISLSGNDGGSTGRDWPLILEKITLFEKHPITNELNEIVTDVSALFEVDNNWTVIGRNHDNVPLLATRTLGLGKIVLSSGERIARDPVPTSNRYETDINKASNKQYIINLFQFFKTTTTTDIKVELERQEEQFKIFPNPTTSFVTVVGKDIKTIIVLSPNGQLIKEVIVNNQEQTEIDLSALAKGIYFLKITTEKGVYLKQVSSIGNNN